MPLKLLGIGAFGNMLSHSALHLANCNEAQFIRVLDRGKQSAHHCEARKNWELHGAQCPSLRMNIRHCDWISVFANAVKQSTTELESSSAMDCFALLAKTDVGDL